MNVERSQLLPGPLEILKELNLGTILLAIYILLDLGAFQGVFDYIVMPLRIPYIVAIMSLLYAVYLGIRGQIQYTGTTKLFIFLCIYIIVDAQLRSSELASEHLLTLFLQYLANYIIMVTCVRKPVQFIFLLDVIVVGVSHSCFHAIMQGGKLYDSIWLKDENHISIIASYAIPLAYILWMSYRSKLKKSIYVGALFLYVTAVAVAASRGGGLAMITSGFFCWVLYDKKIRNLVVVTIAVIMLFMLAPPHFFEEMETLKEGTSEGTAGERIYLWGIALDMFSERPVFGIGPMNYPRYMLAYDIKKEFRFRHRVVEKGLTAMVAHSTPITWLAEFGLFGTFILFWLLKKIYDNWKHCIGHANKTPINVQHVRDCAIIKDIANGIAISHISFWVAACFLTLLPYPFYWILVPLSETWKNISNDFLNRQYSVVS